MNKFIILVLLCFSFILVSCNSGQKATEGTPANQEQNQETGSNDEVTSQGVVWTFSDFTTKIPSALNNDESFLSCTAMNIDMCMSESDQSESFEVSCDDYLVESNRINCEEWKVTMQAKTSSDASLCEGLISNKDNCEYEVALAKWLTSFDVSVCDGISEFNKIQCNNDIVMSEAKEKQDAKLCSKILLYNEWDTYERIFCEEEVGYFIEEQKRLEELESEQQNESTSEEA